MPLLKTRLMAAAELAKGAARIIDVGCDHGYLTAYMLTEGGAAFAYASDINEGPLSKAAETVEKYGVSEKTELRLCAGLDGFSPDDADTVFICGMGGETIADILKNAPWTSDGKHTLVLQPMTRDETLRRFLFENGYSVEEERIVEEEHRLYCILRVRGGVGDAGEKNGFLFSESAKTQPLFPAFVRKQLARYRNIIAEKEKNGHSAEKERLLTAVLEEQNAD